MATIKYKDSNGNYQPIVSVNIQNEVVQTTGNSTTAVMSQKAVSDLIPAQASASNQLADKDFVNSSVSTATATYQGSYNLVSDLSLTTQASHGQIEDALGNEISGAYNNDYAFVQIPTADSTPTEIAAVERYKFNGTRWSFEYTLNNSGFTAAQWAAVNSGITSGLVAKINALSNDPQSSISKLFGADANGNFQNISTANLASVLGGVSSILLKGASGDITTTAILGSDRRYCIFNFLKNKTGIIILRIDSDQYSVYSFSPFLKSQCLSGESDDQTKASITYYNGHWIAIIYGSTDKTIDYKVIYCNMPVTATIELSQDTYTYDGNVKEPTVTVKDSGNIIDPSEYTVTYSNNINAGTSTVTISDNTGGDYNVIGSTTFTINKVTPTVTAPTAKSLTYNGSAQALVNAGSANWGILKYSLDDSTYSTGIPSGTNATSYTVYYKVDGDSNINSVAAKSISVTVAKANQSAPTATGAAVEWGSTATATASGGGGQGSLEWSNGNTLTTVGSKTTKARWSGNSNYNASAWSNEVTLTVNSTHAGHEFVEIGGLKWATINIGANSITDTGLYFQWGDTQGYTASQVGSGSGQKYFGLADYKYGNGTSSPGAAGITKYNSTDGKTVLEASDDAVTVAWGSQWRMPKTAEFQALGNAVNTSWTADYQGSGVAGLVCTDKTDSSKVLFFPACGYCANGKVGNVGSLGRCWSSSLDSSNVQRSYGLYFVSGSITWQSRNYRNYGHPVRGVVNE